MASESKGIFLANMSHEIRTPLNGMVGIIDLLESDDMPKEQRDHLETLRGSSQALLSILNDILDFSRIEAGRVAIEMEAVNVREIVEEVVALMTPNAEDKGIRLQCSYRQNIPQHIQTDPGRLRQILSNVIGNAVKFTSEGWVDVAVGMSNGFIRIDVIDTGIGIPEDQLEQVFQAFEQADGTTKRNFGGTGLGLSISKQLSHIMNGSLSASSRAGGGSIFTLKLPCDKNLTEQLPRYFAGKRIAWYSEHDEPIAHHAHSLSVFGAELTRIHSPAEIAHNNFDLIVLFDEAALQDRTWFTSQQFICYCGPRLNAPVVSGDKFSVQSLPIYWKRFAEVGTTPLDSPSPSKAKTSTRVKILP